MDKWFREYIFRVETAERERRGKELASLFSLLYSPNQFPSPQNFWDSLKRIGKERRESIISQTIDSSWLQSAMIDHIGVLVQLGHNGKWTVAYHHQNSLIKVMGNLFQESENGWMLPLVVEMCFQLRALAALASKSELPVEKEEGSLASATQHLMTLFRISVTSKEKLGILCFLNHLCKILFLHNNVARCKNLFQGVKQTMISEDQFSICERVTYQFYFGRVHLYEGHYDLAQKSLEFAFTRCHPRSYKNKRLALIFLIPVRLFRDGTLPPRSLLQKYGLNEYDALVRAIRTGNFRRFNEALEKGSDFFIKMGVFLIIEKLRLLLLRNLIKRFYEISKEVDSSRAHHLCLKSFAKVLQSFGEDTDDDEVECMVATLIEKRHLRGYISHAHAKLVMAKENAFPPLGSK